MDGRQAPTSGKATRPMDTVPSRAAIRTGERPLPKRSESSPATLEPAVVRPLSVAEGHAIPTAFSRAFGMAPCPVGGSEPVLQGLPCGSVQAGEVGTGGGLGNMRSAVQAFFAAACATAPGALVSLPFPGRGSRAALENLLAASADAHVYVGASHLHPLSRRGMGSTSSSCLGPAS
jgi:hypothetical protein